MDLHVTISKPINLGKLTKELKAFSNQVTGLSLNADTDLTVHGADGLNEQDVMTLVSAHVMPPPRKTRQELKVQLENATGLVEIKQAIKDLLDL